jgi:hypothetical protein
MKSLRSSTKSSYFPPKFPSPPSSSCLYAFRLSRVTFRSLQLRLFFPVRLPGVALGRRRIRYNETCLRIRYKKVYAPDYFYLFPRLANFTTPVTSTTMSSHAVPFIFAFPNETLRAIFSFLPPCDRVHFWTDDKMEHDLT